MAAPAARRAPATSASWCASAQDHPGRRAARRWLARSTSSAWDTSAAGVQPQAHERPTGPPSSACSTSSRRPLERLPPRPARAGQGLARLASRPPRPARGRPLARPCRRPARLLARAAQRNALLAGSAPAAPRARASTWDLELARHALALRDHRGRGRLCSPSPFERAAPARPDRERAARVPSALARRTTRTEFLAELQPRLPAISSAASPSTDPTATS